MIRKDWPDLRGRKQKHEGWPNVSGNSISNNKVEPGVHGETKSCLLARLMLAEQVELLSKRDGAKVNWIIRFHLTLSLSLSLGQKRSMKQQCCYSQTDLNPPPSPSRQKFEYYIDTHKHRTHSTILQRNKERARARAGPDQQLSSSLSLSSVCFCFSSRSSIQSSSALIAPSFQVFHSSKMAHTSRNARGYIGHGEYICKSDWLQLQLRAMTKKDHQRNRRKRGKKGKKVY